MPIPRPLLRRAAALPCLVVAAMVAPSPAAADDVVASLTRITPISGYGGVVAWSDFDAPTSRYVLAFHRRGQTARAPVAGAARPFDVSLGPDERGRVVALYTRCRRKSTGCDVYRYDLSSKRERKVAAVSSPDADEAWPAQWRSRIAFVRRGKAYIRNPLDRRPAPGGKKSGFPIACDVPYVRTLTRGSTSRRLDRSQCGETTSLSIRDGRIVQVASDEEGAVAPQSQVRLLNAAGGRARLLARAGGGLSGYSPFVSASQSASDVVLTRTGNRQPHNFLRIDLRSGRLREIDPHVPLAGRVARDERGRFWYLQGLEPDPSSDTGCALDPQPSMLGPCRLVRASADPFTPAQRTLAPRLSRTVPNVDTIRGTYPGNLAVTGAIRRDVVRAGAVVRSLPLAGVKLELVRATAIGPVEAPFHPTGVTTTSDAGGLWSLPLSRPPSYAQFAAVAPALGIASQAVDVSVDAAVTLKATGRTLTGTVNPAQPGRSVVLQRMTAAGGAGQDQWADVASAALSADGTAFAATMSGPGVYQAVLPPAGTGASLLPDPGTYSGTSPRVTVAG